MKKQIDKIKKAEKLFARIYTLFGRNVTMCIHGIDMKQLSKGWTTETLGYSDKPGTFQTAKKLKNKLDITLFD